MDTMHIVVMYTSCLVILNKFYSFKKSFVYRVSKWESRYASAPQRESSQAKHTIIFVSILW